VANLFLYDQAMSEAQAESQHRAWPWTEILPGDEEWRGATSTITITYDCDPLYRLASASYSAGAEYECTYDAVGNRQTMTSPDGETSYTYDAANRLTSVGGVAYTWDANGNLTSDGVRSYSYDHANRLTQVTQGSVTAQYVYNGDGVRISKIVAGETTEYALDLLATLPVVISDTDAVYLYGLDIIAQQQSERLYYMHDGLGSVRQLVDTTGQVEANYAYDPFGVPVVEGDESNPYQYTGEAWDAEVGLLYLRARYYQPEVGRFVSRDPWTGSTGRPQAMSGPYTYVGNNPATYVDPTGMWRWADAAFVYHRVIEDYYALTPENPYRQLEYPIPGTPHHRPDMFDSETGDVYEIKAWFEQAQGVVQVKMYVAELLAAATRGELAGEKLGRAYNWNSTPFHPGTRINWGAEFRIRMPGFPAADLVADCVGEGVVVYWLEPNSLSLLAKVPFLVPNKRLVKPPNWVPGLRPARQPGYTMSVQQACGYGLIGLGVGVIAVTIVEDFLTLGGGSFDDALTVPAGIYFIDYGQRLAVFVPAPVP
jgi:RHS repeat-associated protein